MPIYEYECKACGHRLEAIQKISDDPLSDCPECKKPELRKLISAAGFRLKGGGWYETDFKAGNKKKNLAQTDTAKDSGKSTGDGKSSSANSGGKSDAKKSSGGNT